MSKIRASVIIAAAGSGKRMKSDIPKQFIKINGKPIAAYTIEKFEAVDEICEIIIVTGKGDIDFFENEIIKKYKYKKIKAVVAGGEQRQHSVFNALTEADKSCDVVLVHDCARPFVSEQDIKKIINETILNDACVLGVKLKDTIKMCDERGFVEKTPNRELLWAAQTPQCFKYDIIMKAHLKAKEDGFLGTDDSMLAERIGIKVKMVEGSYDNIKITTPEDLFAAEKRLLNNG